MESVLRSIASLQLGADHVVVHPTRSSRGFRVSLDLIARAIPAMFALPRGSVVHVHLSMGGSFVREGLLVWLARLRRLPVVVTNHGSKLPVFAEDHPRLVSFVLRQADVSLVLSSEAKALSISLAPETPCRLVFNPVAVDPTAPPVDETGPVVLFAGELGVRKGVDVLLAAWPRVREVCPEASLLLVGRRTALAIDPQPGLLLLDERPQSEIRDLIHQARVIVLPSRHEAQPMILLEAAAAGRPFVSTPVGGIPDLADGVQALVPVGDFVALAGEVIKLLTQRDIAVSRGEAGYDRHKESRSIEALDGRFRAIYRFVADMSATTSTTLPND